LKVGRLSALALSQRKTAGNEGANDFGRRGARIFEKSIGA
jgi:hypothetical protein